MFKCVLLESFGTRFAFLPKEHSQLPVSEISFYANAFKFLMIEEVIKSLTNHG